MEAVTELPTRSAVLPLAGASMIASADDAWDAPAPTFSRTFAVTGAVESAHLSITALGVFDVIINGRAVTDEVLAPGWTDYRYRLIFDEHDITALLVTGENVIEVTVGNGWYRGRLARPARRDLYGRRRGVIARLDVVMADGEQLSVVTDERWLSRPSEVVADDLYDGCTILLASAGTRSLGREATERLAFDHSLLRPRTFPPVRATQTLDPVEAVVDEAGALVVDFGQNLVGWVEFRVDAPVQGERVRVQHAEVLVDGRLATAPLRDAAATDTYVLDDAESVQLHPRFTFHGFRYARIDGVPAHRLHDLRAVVIGTDLRRTGWLETSDPLLNQLHQNTVWSARGNFLSLPTDCPQRDERLGWTADIQVFVPTAAYVFDTRSFLENWLEDLYASQAADGSVQVVIPDVYRRESVATAGWGDAVVIVPWELYQASGDREILERAFPHMMRWLARVRRETGERLLWIGGHQYGDWLDPTAPPEDPAAALTDRDLVATAYFQRSTAIVGEVARVLGRSDEAVVLRDDAKRIRSAFRDAYVTPSGRLSSESQTAYALAIRFGLLEAHELEWAGARLADLVRRTGFTIGTGFLGTPIVLDALTDTGHEAVAFRLLTQTECPSWLYPVTQGATTIWERWDSLRPDGTLNPGEMTSFNHYALGAVADWMHRRIGGLSRGSAGWGSVTIRPPLHSGLSSASTAFDSPHGRIESSWWIENETMRLDVTVPDGVTATVVLPGERRTVGTGRHSFASMLPRHEDALTAATTTRQAMDRPALWNAVSDAVGRIRPDWSGRDIAAAAWPYLGKPLPEFARAVGKSIPTVEESRLRDALERLLALPDSN